MITSIQLLKVLISFMGSFSLAVIVVPLVIEWVKSNHLLDNPNERASHTIPTPTLGGIGFLPGIVLGIVLIPFSWEIGAILLAAITLFFTGLRDDTKDMRASVKLVIQLLVGVLLFVAGIQFNSLNGIMGFEEIPAILALVITVVFFAGIINSFNLIDGIDGLAAGLGFINSLFYSMMFIWMGDIYFGILAIAFAGALLGFLAFNFNPAKIFMGDTGSLLIGLFMSVFFLKAFSFGNEAIMMMAFATILFPAIDMSRLFIVRMLKGGSPFKADKNHYHHLLMKAGDNHKKAALTCYAFQVLYILAALVISNSMEITPAVIVFHCLSVMLYVIVDIRFYLNAKKKRGVLKGEVNTVINKNNLLKNLV